MVAKSMMATRNASGQTGRTGRHKLTAHKQATRHAASVPPLYGSSPQYAGPPPPVTAPRKVVSRDRSGAREPGNKFLLWRPPPLRPNLWARDSYTPPSSLSHHAPTRLQPGCIALPLDRPRSSENIQEPELLWPVVGFRSRAVCSQ